MTRKLVCKLLGITNAYITLVLKGKRNSELGSKIKYLLNFEDSFEAVVRYNSFQELCDVVIKRAKTRVESKEVELAMRGKSLRGFITNNYNANELEHNVMIMFDKVTFLDRKMQEFITSPYLETMCDIGMRSTRKLEVRKMANTLKLIHQEFWKPNIKSNAVSKV